MCVWPLTDGKNDRKSILWAQENLQLLLTTLTIIMIPLLYLVYGFTIEFNYFKRKSAESSNSYLIL